MAWYDEFFDETYLLTYQTPEEITQGQVDFIESVLNLPKGSRILDLACGFGRQTIPLAKRGYLMTGLDYTSMFLEIARKKAEEEKLKIDFVQGDMRKIPFRNHFDGIVNYFTSFGFFSDEENFETLKEVSQALKPQGKFLLEIMNREALIKNFHKTAWYRVGENVFVLNEYELDLLTGRLKVKRIIMDEKRKREKYFDIRIYPLHEISSLLQNAGLKVMETYGKWDMTPYSLTSPRMAVISQKL
jgi:ubiquinone/menaquinone biosynthesis C-methylase UbiE